jgi:hypothetical protein
MNGNALDGVYVPGTWYCAKCGFVLVQSNLNSADGTVTARDEPGDKCPNDGAPLWRQTWEKSYRELCEDFDKRLGEISEFREALEPFAVTMSSEVATTITVKSEAIRRARALLSPSAAVVQK